MADWLPETVTSMFGSQRRSVELVRGRRYLVSPMNGLKKKHRGRYCVLVDVCWRSKQSGPPDGLVVRFEDTGRLGRVEFDDLVSPG